MSPYMIRKAANSDLRLDGYFLLDLKMSLGKEYSAPNRTKWNKLPFQLQSFLIADDREQNVP